MASQPSIDLTPMPDTIDGKPISSSMSPETLLKYLDQQVQARVRPPGETAAVPPPPPQLAIVMVPALAKFGTKNLLAAHELQPSPRVATGDQPGTTSQFKQFEDWMIMQTLESTAPDSDLPVLVGMAKKDPVILSLILRKSSWRNSPGMSELMLEKLKSIEEPASDPMTVTVLNFALSSPNPVLQKNLADLLHKWINKPDSKLANGGNGSLQLDNLIFASILTDNKPCEALFPVWATTRLAGAGDLNSPEEKIRNGNLLINAAKAFRSRPEAFAQAPLSEGVAILLAPMKGAAHIGVVYDFLAAGIGDADAFKELLKASDQIMQHPAQRLGGPENTPTVLNGNPVPNPYEIPSYAESLLKCVIYEGAGDKLTGVLNHIDSATYSGGRWTVIDPQFKKDQAAAPAPAAAASSLAPSASPNSK